MPYDRNTMFVCEESSEMGWIKEVKSCISKGIVHCDSSVWTVWK